MKKQPLIVICGPTASGKTSLGVAVAQAFGGEVVSADSMQIYQGMDIASAMPTAQETQTVKHHLINFLPQSERFSVAAYCDLARQKIAQIADEGKFPIIVGGTGLYINSIIDNIEYSECETDLSIRKKLEEALEENGIEPLMEELKRVDPQSAQKLHINDEKRIIRALEFYRQNGFAITEQERLSRLNQSPYDVLLICLNAREREFLYERINRRVDKMVEEGLLEEAERCLNSIGSTSAQAIGHKELKPYFDGEITLDEALENLKRQTRRYAKRQITWFKRNENANWFYIDEYESADSLAEVVKKAVGEFLNKKEDAAG